MIRPSLTIQLDGLAEMVRDVVQEQLAKECQAGSQPPPATSDCWLTVSQAASHTGFTETTIRHWCSTGLLRAEKVRGRWRLRVGDLDAFCRCGGRAAPGTVDVDAQATAVVQRLLRPRAVGE